VSVVCPGYVNTNIVKNLDRLRKMRPGIWQPTPEMIKLSEVSRENTDKILALGMDPKIMAEIVIKAIENDILYVITHPEYIPAVRARFERIYEDTLKLHEEVEVKWESKTKIFKNDSPAFTIRYPENLIELKPNPMVFPRNKPVLAASFLFDLLTKHNFLVFVRRSSNQQLEVVAKEVEKSLRPSAREIKIVSNKPVTLRDGTPAYECVIELISVGFNKGKSIHLSAFKDEYRIRISIFTGAKYFNENIENLKNILYSLEFHS
jgi:hypothetical protein